MTGTTISIATSRLAVHGPVARSLVLAACAMLGTAALAEAGADESIVVEEIVVSGELTQRMGEVGSWSAVDADELDLIGATHPTEALVRVPGVWISRGSGQEHLTAIRSAVLTGAGACGEFLYLENGLPVRPAGFCNVNNLFELNTEQAGRIEVWRGPASAVLGGNALHGAINVINRLPERNSIGLEGGSYGSYRASGEFNVQTGNHRVAGTLFGSSTNGYRDDTGHDQQKLSLVHQTMAGGFEVENTLNFTNLEQETGAFVNGFKAYEDDDLRKTNPAPEAYRDAWSVRIASRWAKETWHFTPYLRASDMEFLQHFLPGQPRERNDQTSGGIVFGFNPVNRDDLDFSLGAQLEYMSGHLDQWQAEPLTDSTPFNNAVRPQGWQYDYDVDSFLAAGYYDLAWAFSGKTRLVHSLRLEYLEYDYKNLMLDGNTRDDGTACGFGGCLYNRPESRKDDFTNVAGRLGVEQEIGDGVGYITFGSGFRPPQATELYRLQRGQDVADLKSEELVSLSRSATAAAGGTWQALPRTPTTSSSETGRDSTSPMAGPRPGVSRRKLSAPGATTPSASPAPTPSTSTTSTAASPAARPSRRATTWTRRRSGWPMAAGAGRRSAGSPPRSSSTTSASTTSTRRTPPSMRAIWWPTSGCRRG